MPPPMDDPMAGAMDGALAQQDAGDAPGPAVDPGQQGPPMDPSADQQDDTPPAQGPDDLV